MHPSKLNWAELSPQQKQRIKERRDINLECGSYNHPMPPFGYRYVQDKYGYRIVVPDDKLAPVILGAYLGVAYAEINSKAELATYLTAGLGKKYFPSTAIELLQDVRNMGWYLLPQHLGGKHKKATNFKATIVTEGLFIEAVSRTLQEGW